MIGRIKGTQDLINLSLFNGITEKIKGHLLLYNFHEIATPVIEPAELFIRSLGQETDVISKEMYTIPNNDSTNNEEIELICLRPEATASAMRAFLENHISAVPWKIFILGPMFRRERPQKGRFRQFHQISIEIIGTEQWGQDAYFIAMLDRLFSQLFSMNTYGLLLNFMGCLSDRIKYKEVLLAFLESSSAQLCETCLIRKKKNILRVFDCKQTQCQKIYAEAPFITQSLCSTCNDEWNFLQTTLQQLSIAYSLAPQLVRGLDYYGKIVFEFINVEHLGSQNTFCGGGRYDALATELGSTTDYPSIGAAIGIERLMLILEKKAETLVKPEPQLFTILSYEHAQDGLCIQIADLLHAHQYCVDILLGNDSLKSKLRKANKMGATYCIIVGPDEQQKGTAVIKNMGKGTEVTVAHRDIITVIKQGNI